MKVAKAEKIIDLAVTAAVIDIRANGVKASAVYPRLTAVQIGPLF